MCFADWQMHLCLGLLSLPSTAVPLLDFAQTRIYKKVKSGYFLIASAGGKNFFHKNNLTASITGCTFTCSKGVVSQRSEEPLEAQAYI